MYVTTNKQSGETRKPQVRNPCTTDKTLNTLAILADYLSTLECLRLNLVVQVCNEEQTRGFYHL